MRNQLTGHKASAAAVAIGAGAALVLVGCSSNSNSTPTTTPTTAPTGSAAPTGATGTVPGPPAGSQQLSTAQDGQATYTRFSTSQTPTQVTSYYNTALTGAGFKVTNTGSGGGGWGQYGGSGSTLEANNGSTWVAVNAGGQTGKTTYFETCVGPSESAVDSCQSNNHGSSQSS